MLKVFGFLTKRTGIDSSPSPYWVQGRRKEKGSPHCSGGGSGCPIDCLTLRRCSSAAFTNIPALVP